MITPGTIIDNYRICGQLGRGGMAEVYKASQINLYRYEALKVLLPEKVHDAVFVERFLREAQTVAQLQHPNIAVVYTVSDSTAPQPYFTMELVEGGSLADLIRTRGQLSLEEASLILHQIASALDYAHRNGLIHRDIKPANILLKRGAAGYVVKVVDFGIAKADEGTGSTRLTQIGTFIGTPEYMSPEQAGSGDQVSYRTDQYSLAILAYEMLCGAPPFRSEGTTSRMSVVIKHIREEPLPPSRCNPRLSASTDAAIMRALAKHPTQRFASCTEFVETLASSQYTINEIPSVSVTPHNNRGSKSTFPSAAVAVILAVLAGAVLIIGGTIGSNRSETYDTDVGISQPQIISNEVPDASDSSQEEQVREVIQSWRQAWENHDIDSHMSIYADPVTVDGKLRSLSSYRAYHEKENWKQPTMQIEISDIEIYFPDSRQATVTFYQHFKGWGRQPKWNWESWGRSHMILRNESDNWKIYSESFQRERGGEF